MSTYDSEHRKAYSQNFVKNPSLVRYILSFIDIAEGSQIVEIGPGEGSITRELVDRYSVIAIEKDEQLGLKLQAEFPNLDLRIEDALKVQLPATPYWVVSNPPFQIFSQLIKKLIFGARNPEAILFFGQQEAVERIAGETGTSLISLIFQSFYHVDIPYMFERRDFSPAPGVDVVLLRAVKIPTKLWSYHQEYIRFVTHGFSGQKATLGKNFSAVFTFEQWKRLAKTYRFTITAQPTDLSIEQWKGLFAYYRDHVDEGKKV